MKIENTLSVIKVAGIVAGKSALRFMKIGMLNTAAHNLQQAGRNEIQDISGQFKRGYSEKIAPNMKNFKLLKGKK